MTPFFFLLYVAVRRDILYTILIQESAGTSASPRSFPRPRLIYGTSASHCYFSRPGLLAGTFASPRSFPRPRLLAGTSASPRLRPPSVFDPPRMSADMSPDSSVVSVDLVSESVS